MAGVVEGRQNGGQGVRVRQDGTYSRAGQIWVGTASKQGLGAAEAGHLGEVRSMAGQA